MTDWEWFLSSEAGRDRILRGEIEGLAASASSARAQSARMSSQLQRLQGSLETRLQALSAAFDAYVELGDVREQLAGYPDTSAIRRDAVGAIEVLSRGRVPGPVDHRDLDYWLSYAVNAVIAVVGAHPDPAAERRATELSPDAELFIVTAAGALGAGPAVAERVAPLLICDGTLAPRQVVLWQAVLADVFGPMLHEVQPVWRSALDTSAELWVAWVRECGRSAGPVECLRWLDSQTKDPSSTVEESRAVVSSPPVAAPGLRRSGEPTPSSGPDPADPRTGLRGVVIGLVGQGMGDEAALLARSRVLRAQVEDPTGPVVEAELELPGRPVTEVVQDSLLASPPGSPRRRELLSWVSPGLVAAAGSFGTVALQLPVAEAKVSTEAGMLTVTHEGLPPERLLTAETTIGELTMAPLGRILPPGLVAGALLALALVAAVTSHPRGALLLLLGAVLAGAVFGYLLLDRRRAGQRRADLLAELHEGVAQGQRDAQDVRAAQQLAASDAVRLAETIRIRLQPSGQPARR